MMDTTAAVTGFGVGMSLLVFMLALAVVGLMIGGLARLILPGPDPMSVPATMGFGVAGSFFGGLLGRLLNLPSSVGFALGVAGAAFLIWFFRRRKAP
jgi:uncharacterized membrane protein YeaQ/YmgE (transglycosylase-associated protein family)